MEGKSRETTCRFPNDTCDIRRVGISICFLLRKWNSSEKVVLKHISPELVDDKWIHHLSDPQQHTKTLGIQWNSCQDSFCLEVLRPAQLCSRVRHRKDFRYFGLVFPNHHQSNDPPTESVGGQDQLG